MSVERTRQEIYSAATTALAMASSEANQFIMRLTRLRDLFRAEADAIDEFLKGKQEWVLGERTQVGPTYHMDSWYKTLCEERDAEKRGNE